MHLILLTSIRSIVSVLWPDVFNTCILNTDPIQMKETILQT